MNKYNLEILKNAAQLAERANEIIITYLKKIINQQSKANIAFSGGRTPSKTYSLLSKENIDWEFVNLFLVDERWVSPKDELSNSRMVRETLLSTYPGNKVNFFDVPTVTLKDPTSSAKAYSEIIKNSCASENPSLDLIVLGIGDDGHTASLFPYSDSLHDNKSSVTIGKGKGIERITFTSQFINLAKKVIFLVNGEDKHQALKRLLDPKESPIRTPAKLINPKGEILILADDSAARDL